MDLKQYARIIWRWLWLIAASAIIAGGAAFVANMSRQPEYSSTTTLLVNAPRVALYSQYSDADLRTTARLLGTYAELLVSRPVLQEVVTNLGLPFGPATLGSKTTVTATPNTLLIQVEVVDSNPERAAAIANEIVRVLNLREQDLLGNSFVTTFRGDALKVIEPAQPRPRPVGTPIQQTMLLVAVAAAVVAAGIAFLIEYLTNAVQSEDDIEAATGLRSLAAVGQIRGGDPAARLVTALDPLSPTAESFRMVLAHPAFQEGKEAYKTILVSSSEPGEGKSTIVANLGVALAQAGKRVILVDMDLRRPTLHRFFKRANHHGVTTALQRPEGESLTEGNHLVSTGVENLWLMPSGAPPSNPARIFRTPQLLTLIQELEAQADVVLFDSPAALVVVDSSLLAQYCDGALIVVRVGSTRIDTLASANELLTRSGTNMIGVLQNRPTARRGRYYGPNHRTRWLSRDQALASGSLPSQDG